MNNFRYWSDLFLQTLLPKIWEFPVPPLSEFFDFRVSGKGEIKFLIGMNTHDSQWCGPKKRGRFLAFFWLSLFWTPPFKRGAALPRLNAMHAWFARTPFRRSDLPPNVDLKYVTFSSSNLKFFCYHKWNLNFESRTHQLQSHYPPTTQHLFQMIRFNCFGETGTWTFRVVSVFSAKTTKLLGTVCYKSTQVRSPYCTMRPFLPHKQKF